MKLCFVILLFGVLNPCFADAYKCKDPSGKITYQQSPCAGHDSNDDNKIWESNSIATPDASSDIQFTGSISNQVRQIAAVTAVAALKGRDCEWAIKVTKKMGKCVDFLRYIIEGGPYDRGSSRFLEFTTEQMEQDGISTAEMRDMARDAQDVVKYRNFVHTYLKSQ